MVVTSMPRLQGLCVWLVSVASLALVGCGGTSDAAGGGGAGGMAGHGGGAAGDGGNGGGAAGFGGSGAAGTGDCIDFSHAEAVWGPPRDLRVAGTGFEAHEGDTVRLVIVTIVLVLVRT